MQLAAKIMMKQKSGNIINIASVGGIETNELDKKTLEIKKMPGAYACGEVLNIDGECGGYNIHWALASGYTVALDIISKCEK